MLACVPLCLARVQDNADAWERTGEGSKGGKGPFNGRQSLQDAPALARASVRSQCPPDDAIESVMPMALVVTSPLAPLAQRAASRSGWRSSITHTRLLACEGRLTHRHLVGSAPACRDGAVCSGEATRIPSLLPAAASRPRRARSSFRVAAAPALPSDQHSESEAPTSGAEPIGLFGLSQRWILIAAASCAFVLCNMDKV